MENEESKEQKEPYSGGFAELSSPQHAFNVRFFLVALFFILLTAEFLILLPWIITCRSDGLTAAFCALIFLIFCVVGAFFEYKRGALKWK